VKSTIGDLKELSTVFEAKLYFIWTEVLKQSSSVSEPPIPK
jgi:hypothetical protein